MTHGIKVNVIGRARLSNIERNFTSAASAVMHNHIPGEYREIPGHR